MSQVYSELSWIEKDFQFGHRDILFMDVELRFKLPTEQQKTLQTR